MPKSRTRSVTLSMCVTGTSHQKRNETCEDSCRQYRRGGVLTAAVADGAGSAKHSGVGAKIAVDTAIAWSKKNPLCVADPDIEKHLRRGLAAVHRSLKRYAAIKECSVGDLSTTLSLAIVRNSEAFCIRVGDGAVVLRERCGSYVTLSREKKVGAGNVTDFITDDDYCEQAEFSRLSGQYDGLVAMSDGLEALAFSPDRTPFAPFLDPLVSHLVSRGAATAQKDLRAFLQSERVRSATDDDLSLILARWGVPIK